MWLATPLSLATRLKENLRKRRIWATIAQGRRLLHQAGLQTHKNFTDLGIYYGLHWQTRYTPNVDELRRRADRIHAIDGPIPLRKHASRCLLIAMVQWVGPLSRPTVDTTNKVDAAIELSLNSQGPLPTELEAGTAP